MEPVQIKVNGVVIPEADILQEIQYHPASDHRAAYIEAAKSLIVGEVLKQHADEKGYDFGDDRFDVQHQDKIIDKLIEEEVDFPEATEEECLNYYKTHPEKFMTSPLFEVRHILLASDPKDLEDREQVKEVAEQIIQKIIDGEAFERFITQSACPSKEVGGSLGQIGKGQTVPEFEKALMMHQFEGTGILSKLIKYPVESRFGFHIIMLENRVVGNELPFEQVKDRIQNYLDERVKHKALAQYVNILLSDANIEGFKLDELDSPLIQ